MCDLFLLQRMENYQGDLADIILAGGGPIRRTLGSTTNSSSGDLPPTVDNSWQFNQSSDPMIYHSDDFGHPFLSLRDPLLLEQLDSSFFTSSNSIDQDSSGFCGGSSNIFVGDNNNNIEDQQEDQIKRAAACNNNNNNSNNIFSRILQISPNNNVKLPIPPCESPVTVPRVVLKPPPPSNSTLVCNDHHMIESTGVQISSPPNTGIKRRKNQAKKVVCIPAPAPANSRPTGEIVPSDLWAWRKYGQKPIKGSPYPRGYYRCSSSKGCSARKQVERSRTDPNMLVITYTSEHNHPWPTQRNALAGSTRTQPTKNINTKNSPGSQSQKEPLSSLKEEQQKDNTNNIIDNILSTSIDVKEEEMDDEKEITEKENGEQLGFSGHDQSYRPEMPNFINHPDQDFFADLGEIEADPLNLLFTQGFSGDDHEERENNKALSLDPFSFYDWTENI